MDTLEEATPPLPERRAERQLVTVRIPAGWTLAGLVAGLAFGLMLARTTFAEPVLAFAAPVGTLWLRALQVTIVPLVAALLVIGIAQMAQAARAGDAARRMLSWVIVVLILSGIVGALVTPFLLDLFPPPASAAGVLSAEAQAQEVPGIAAFVESLIAPNIVSAAAETAMLPLTLFFAAFALALVRLPADQRDLLLGLFRALAAAVDRNKAHAVATLAPDAH